MHQISDLKNQLWRCVKIHLNTIYWFYLKYVCTNARVFCGCNISLSQIIRSQSKNITIIQRAGLCHGYFALLPAEKYRAGVSSCLVYSLYVTTTFSLNHVGLKHLLNDYMCNVPEMQNCYAVGT
jgi:hypothetical protein